MANEISKLITPDGVSHDVRDDNANKAIYHGQVNSSSPDGKNDFNNLLVSSGNDNRIAVYWCQVSGMLNAPESSGYGYLECISTLQRYTNYSTKNIFLRTYVNSTWSAWVQSATPDISGKVSKSGDTMTGELNMKGHDVRLGTPSSSSDDSGDLVWCYGNDNEKVRLFTQNTPTTAAQGRLLYRAKKSDGTVLFDSTVPTSADVDGKLSKAGDTATGKITFNAGIGIKAGSQIANPPYFITLNESFASGGSIGYADTSTVAGKIGAVKKSGDTMTGELKTSFNSCVVGGSRECSQNTISNMCNELRFSSGCCGSVSITTAYTKDGVTIPSSWYNYIYVPHRSGGVSGAASGDNCNYGTLILSNMTGDTEPFFIRIKGSSDYVSHVYKLVGYVTNSVDFTRSHSSVSYKEGLVCNRFGNVVTFAGYFSCGATIAANTTLYSGLPKPAGGKHIYFTWSGLDFYLHGGDGTIRTNGQITPKTYVGTFTYVCA